MERDNPTNLRNLGSKNTTYYFDNPTFQVLETFKNQFPKREYMVEYKTDEFTSLCPKTGQPDFATIKLRYIPNKKCIETKSFKLYLLRYRQYGAFMETIINQILSDCKKVAEPRFMEVIGKFKPRGGTYITVKVNTNEKY